MKIFLIEHYVYMLVYELIWNCYLFEEVYHSIIVPQNLGSDYLIMSSGVFMSLY